MGTHDEEGNLKEVSEFEMIRIHNHILSQREDRKQGKYKKMGMQCRNMVNGNSSMKKET